MQKVAIQVANDAMKAENAEEKDIAAYIKKDFDKRYGPTWHAVVGKSESDNFTISTAPC